MASTSVVLPWSTCAMMAMLRIDGLLVFMGCDRGARTLARGVHRRGNALWHRRWRYARCGLSSANAGIFAFGGRWFQTTIVNAIYQFLNRGFVIFDAFCAIDFSFGGFNPRANLAVIGFLSALVVDQPLHGFTNENIRTAVLAAGNLGLHQL